MDAVGVGKSKGISDIHLEGVSVRRCNTALPIVCVCVYVCVCVCVCVCALTCVLSRSVVSNSLQPFGW